MPVRFSVQDEQGANNVCCVGIARLKPGVTPEQASAELNSSMPAFKEFRFAEAKERVLVRPLQTAVLGDVRKGLLLLLFSVGLVLLIACANVANLSLVRATQRSRELAIRAALGAGKDALVRHSLTESFLIALGGTIAGSILSMWITDLAVSRAPSQVPRLEETAADATVFAFAVGLCVFTTVLFGLLPAWRASHVDPQTALNTAGRGSTDALRGGRLRAVLVSAEVALGTVLVIGSGLLLSSLHRVINAPRGFDGGDILTLDLVLPSPRYPAIEKQASFFRAVHEGVGSIPGVMNVAVTTWLPLAGEAMDFVAPEGTVDVQNIQEKGTLFAKPIVSAEYFTAMRIPLRAGRLLRNEGESERVAVLSESAARILWPGEDPLGRKVVMPLNPGRYWRVIGIVSDLLSGGLDRAPTPAFYRFYEQQGATRFSIVVRTALAPDALAKSVREAVSRVDPEIPVPEMRSMPGLIAKSVQPRRFQAVLVSGFALVAVLLAAIGIYGVVAYSVAQRRKEIGVRIALGAKQLDVRNLVFRNGMAPVLIGLCAGLLAAAFLARLIASLLFQVSTLDAVTFISAPLILVLAGALPCWLTARQAAHIDPVVALRLE
jgi:predicted permease